MLRRRHTGPGLAVLFDSWWWSQYVPDPDAAGERIDASGWDTEALARALA